MVWSNPAGTNGFEFLEFCTSDKTKLTQQFLAMGFKPVAHHLSEDVTLFQQNQIRFILNTTQDSYAKEFARQHGPSVCAMGFLVENAQTAFQHAVTHGAKPYLPNQNEKIYDIPAIEGIGGSKIYFIDYQSKQANYAHHFTPLPSSVTQVPGLTYIDHVTHNLHRGNMDKWANFYELLFNFREIRYFDIEGKLTGLKSRAMTSPCGKIRIPLNESADDKSQIEEFIKNFQGEGIQHIALGTDNIYDTVEILKKNNIEFLNTPDTYYDLIEKRLPDHGEPLDKLRNLRILIDGHVKPEKKLLLQIFTQNMLGPVFFEIIQRKGDEGFGEGNFRALFESIELDQIKRGVLSDD